MTLTKYERETVINMNDEDKFMFITTHQPAMITKLDKNPSAEKVETLSERGAVYKMPARLLSIRTGTRRKMTDEQKQAAATRLLRARTNRGN
jgi:hypothetical protein